MGKGLTEFEYEDRILKSLRRRNGVATAGDVAADTGLPLEETEIALRRMLQFYASHLDVDDEGNLLYRFDPKLKRRGEEAGRRWHQFKKKAWAAFTLIFKVWIMVMLIGYTVLFLALLLAFAIAGLAAASSQNSDSGGGQMMLMPFYLILRVLEVVFWISILDPNRGYGGGYGRGHGRGRYGRGYGRGYGGGFGGGFGRSMRQKKKPEEPLYKRIFRYVFGPEEEERDPLAAEKAFARFVRSRQGRVTAADWASRTGQSLEAADRALTGAAMRFRGDIDVSDEGTLVYRFDDLRTTAEEGRRERAPAPIWQQKAQVAPLAGKNPKSTNTWITTFNSFNLVMGLGVLFSATTLPVAVLLGWVPLLFSTVFFAIPGARAIKRRRAKERAEKENERRELVQAVYLATEDGVVRPVRAEVFDTSSVGDRLIGDFEAEMQVSDDGERFYTFPRVAEQRRASEQAREATVELVFGKTIFSSDEEELSLEDAAMADFDRRLARELGGEVELDFELEWESAEQSVVEMRS